jgi:hypothetical protein
MRFAPNSFKYKILSSAIAAIVLIGGVGFASVLYNTPSSGYLLCVNNKTKVVTFPNAQTCPAGNTQLVLGAQTTSEATNNSEILGTTEPTIISNSIVSSAASAATIASVAATVAAATYNVRDCYGRSVSAGIGLNYSGATINTPVGIPSFRSYVVANVGAQSLFCAAGETVTLIPVGSTTEIVGRIVNLDKVSGIQIIGTNSSINTLAPEPIVPAKGQEVLSASAALSLNSFFTKANLPDLEENLYSGRDLWGEGAVVTLNSKFISIGNMKPGVLCRTLLRCTPSSVFLKWSKPVIVESSPPTSLSITYENNKAILNWSAPIVTQGLINYEISIRQIDTISYAALKRSSMYPQLTSLGQDKILTEAGLTSIGNLSSLIYGSYKTGSPITSIATLHQGFVNAIVSGDAAQITSTKFILKAAINAIKSSYNKMYEDYNNIVEPDVSINQVPILRMDEYALFIDAISAETIGTLESKYGQFIQSTVAQMNAFSAALNMKMALINKNVKTLLWYRAGTEILTSSKVVTRVAKTTNSLSINYVSDPALSILYGYYESPTFIVSSVYLTEHKVSARVYPARFIGYLFTYP